MNEKLKKMFQKDLDGAKAEIGELGKDFGFFPSGFPYIDFIVNKAGIFPRGGIVELYGLKSSCKTTLVLHAIAEAKRKAPVSVWWSDYEGQLRGMSDYAAAIGVDINDESFIHRTPTTLEQGGQEIQDAILTGELDFIVVDSTASMRPKVEIENVLGDTTQLGVRGKLISELIRNIVGNVNKIVSKGCIPPAIIFINQLYEKVDIKNPALAGKVFDTPASNALKFYASARIELKVQSFEERQIVNPYTLEKSKIRYITNIQAFCEKNKVGIPFKRTSFSVRYGEGVDLVMSFVKAAIAFGAIILKGDSSRMLFMDSAGKEQNLAGLFSTYEWFRKNLEECGSLAERSGMGELWTPILKNRISMVKYAQDVAKECQEEDLVEGEEAGKDDL